MRPIYTEKIKIGGEYHTVDGFTPDEKFLVLADGTRYRFELLNQGEVDLSRARLLEAAGLSHAQDQDWLVDGDSLEGWLTDQGQLKRRLGDEYWKHHGVEYHRRLKLWPRLKAVRGESEQSCISGAAWFLPEDPTLVAAARSRDELHVGVVVTSPAPEIICLLRVFHRQEGKPERGQPPYSVRQMEHGGKPSLSFHWDTGRPIEIQLPSHEALIAWRKLFTNPGQSFSIPELMGRETSRLPEERSGACAPGEMPVGGPELSAKYARTSETAAKKVIEEVASQKKEFAHLSLAKRDENPEYQALEEKEEWAKRRLKYISQHGDLDPHIPGASTWATWKRRLLLEVAKKNAKLGTHLRECTITKAGSACFDSPILRWVE